MGTIISQNIPYSATTLSQQSTPIGAIIPYMGTTAPSGYLACDGGVYSISLYPLLAGFFEAQFGSINYFGGDGTTTFAVPNLQGEFLRGAGTNSHTNQGAGGNVGEHQDGTITPSIISNSGNTSKVAIWTDGAYVDAPTIIGTTLKADSVMPGSIYVTATMTTGSSGASQVAHTSRPTNTSVLYIIKAKSDRLDKITFAEVDDTSVSSDVVWSAEKLTTEFGKITDYSTTEKVVGKWIDGKPIYQKTFNFNVTTYADDTTRRRFLYEDSSATTKMILGWECTCDDGTPNVIWNNSTFSPTMGAQRNFNIACVSNKIQIQYQCDKSIGITKFSGYATLRYTKTTD